MAAAQQRAPAMPMTTFLDQMLYWRNVSPRNKADFFSTMRELADVETAESDSRLRG